MKLKITVTKDILKKSMTCGTEITTNIDNYCDILQTNCAIALAVRDIFPKAKVENTIIVLDTDIISLPKKAREFISTFDMCTPEQRLELPEITFEVEIPQSVIDTIDISSLQKELINHPTLELIEI